MVRKSSSRRRPITWYCDRCGSVGVVAVKDQVSGRDVALEHHQSKHSCKNAILRNIDPKDVKESVVIRPTSEYWRGFDDARSESQKGW